MFLLLFQTPTFSPAPSAIKPVSFTPSQPVSRPAGKCQHLLIHKNLFISPHKVPCQVLYIQSCCCCCCYNKKRRHIIIYKSTAIPNSLPILTYFLRILLSYFRVFFLLLLSFLYYCRSYALLQCCAQAIYSHPLTAISQTHKKLLHTRAYTHAHTLFRALFMAEIYQNAKSNNYIKKHTLKNAFKPESVRLAI